MNLGKFLKITESEMRILHLPIGICMERYGKQYEEDAEMILSFMELLANNLDYDFKQIINRYFEFVNKQIKMNKEFLENGSYKYAKEKQIEPIINSKEFQIDNIFTLGLSYVCTPSRYELLRYVNGYIKQFIRTGDRCLEIATGIGFHCFCVDLQDAYINTFDLNFYSGICLNILGVSPRVNFSQKYYLFNEEEKYDHCIMIELLEHLQEPLEYLKNVNRVLKTGGKAILTFAIRTPQVDHIYLFNSVTEARDMIANANLEIVTQDYFISSFMYYDISQKESLAEASKYSATYACIVKKH